MTGRASPAKAKDGDEPVFAYIRSLPQPQRGIAERVDALAAKTLPALKRSVKWGMAWYGVGDGWCFCCGGFAGHVKLTFGRGTALKPVPPVTPIGMGKDSRGVDLESVDDLDERQAASWMKQATAIPGFGGRSDEPGECRQVAAPERAAPPIRLRLIARGSAAWPSANSLKVFACMPSDPCCPRAKKFNNQQLIPTVAHSTFSNLAVAECRL